MALHPINPHAAGAQLNHPFGGQDSWAYGSEYMRPFESAENSWATSWPHWPAPFPVSSKNKKFPFIDCVNYQ